MIESGRFIFRSVAVIRRRGFTLIELMLVVAIIGLLAAIALPKFSNLVVKAKEASVKGKLGAVRSALSIYYVDNESIYPTQMDALAWGSRYMDEIPTLDIPIRNPAPNSHHGKGMVVGPPGGVIDSMKGPVWYYEYIIVSSASVGLGQVHVECTHTDTRGITWSLY